MEYSFKNIRVGEIVEGTVIQVNTNEILLDLNYVLEGTIYLNEFTNEKVNSFEDVVKIGDNVTALVKKIDEERGQVLLSRIGIIRDENYKVIKDLFKNETTVEAKVESQVNKGLILKYLGFEMFLHESQVDLEKVNLADFVGKTLTVIISEMDDKKQKIKVSRKKLLIEEQKKQRKIEFENLNVDDIIKGTVKETKPYGAIIKLGHNQAILPIGEVSHHRIKKVEDEIKAGDEIEVKLIEKSVKNGRNRISVSRKATLPTPFQAYVKEFGKGSTIKGKVINKLPFGIILELAKGVTGLLHNTEISWNPNDNFAASVVFGDEVEVHIINVNEKQEKISLSKKYLEDNPWGKLTARRGDVVTGIISELQVGKGFTVSVQGVDAFLPADEITEEKIGKLDDVYSIGEEIEAKIIELYKDSWKMKLSVKEVQNARQRAEFDKYIKTQETRTVTLGDLFKDVLEKKK
ncbi:30S ribosomal protein S1 [Mycoplasmatota bacterium]|nr:30S ribosomal protein S1 [Mycoplasmatota bacterium]